MKSICPTSKMFEAKGGTAEEQLGRMITSGAIVASHIVRCVLGSAEDRKPGPIGKHMESMVKVLRNTRSRALDAKQRARILWRVPRFRESLLDAGRPARHAGHAGGAKLFLRPIEACSERGSPLPYSPPPTAMSPG